MQSAVQWAFNAEGPRPKRTLKITYDRKEEELVAVLTVDGESQTITLNADSGGWDDHNALPQGKWYIVKNPRGDDNYFALFRDDGNINHQFSDGGKWRDGIKLGFHNITGSHGCVMGTPWGGWSGYDFSAKSDWGTLQGWIRSSPTETFRYQNNEIPNRSDPNWYTGTSYGTLNVIN